MADGFIHDDDFDKGNYKPEIGDGSGQKFASLSILGHAIRPELFMATEGKRHALGWQRLIRESVDSQHHLSPYQAFDTLKIICHSYAMMMVAVARCGTEFADEYFKQTGVGISLDMKMKDDWREYDIGSIIRTIAKRGKVEKEVTEAWQTMADVDDYMMTATRPAKPTAPIEQREFTTVVDFLNSWVASSKVGLRVSLLFESGAVLNGYLKKVESGFGILKRSDSTSPHMFEFSKIKLIQTTTLPRKTLFSV